MIQQSSGKSGIEHRSQLGSREIEPQQREIRLHDPIHRFSHVKGSYSQHQIIQVFRYFHFIVEREDFTVNFNKKDLERMVLGLEIPVHYAFILKTTLMVGWIVDLLGELYVLDYIVESIETGLCFMRSRTILHCFGCHSKKVLKNTEWHQAQGRWLCEVCCSWNLYNTKSRQSEPEPDSDVNMSRLSNRKKSINMVEKKPLFCHLCLHNQSLVIKLLSQYCPESVYFTLLRAHQ